MRRYPSSPYAASYSFGPGPLSPALKALLIANVAMFVLQKLAPADSWTGADVMTAWLGLIPQSVLGLQIWRPVTYMFLHAGVLHLLFNMLALWMFGTELERRWGTRYFLKFYFVTGIGAGVLTVLFSLMPFTAAAALRESIVIGASGAIFGLLLAYGLSFPDRPIYLYFVFPIPAKYFVLIIGALTFYSAVGELSGVANATHLGGLLVGYLYLKSGRMHPIAEVKYRYLKWKIGRTRRKFDVHSGGRADDWNRRIH